MAGRSAMAVVGVVEGMAKRWREMVRMGRQLVGRGEGSAGADAGARQGNEDESVRWVVAEVDVDVEVEVREAQEAWDEWDDIDLRTRRPRRVKIPKTILECCADVVDRRGVSRWTV
jgi:hypothetical protein